MRYILDNIFLTHETIDFAKNSGHSLLFLKLDFSKAYDKVELSSLFSAMAKMGFLSIFTNMTKLLFEGAEASVCVNRRRTSKFPILQGVRQGCPLAPYLFLIVGEVLNSSLKCEVSRGRIRGIDLPNSPDQQVIAQYADDTSMTIRTEENFVCNTVSFLHTFSSASGLVINWS